MSLCRSDADATTSTLNSTRQRFIIQTTLSDGVMRRCKLPFGTPNVASVTLRGQTRCLREER